MSSLLGRSAYLSLALALWLIARPFQGIWHDGRLYALQALQHLNPSTFSRDLFFLYGSQDQYSLFGSLYASCIALWGLSQGTMALQGLGLGLWFIAGWSLTRVLPGKPAMLALLLIASLDGHYGSHGVFTYGERFLTARLYAEALSLAGLAAWLTGRVKLGGLAFAVACVMHPLMTLPALMVGLGILLQPKMWFGLMGAGVMLALSLGVMGMTPFTGLLQPMDALWLQLVASRSPFIFLNTWEWDGVSRVLFVITVTATAWRILPGGKLRHLAWATLICILGAFAADYVGGSLLKLPLIAGLQLTRVMWVGLVITLILIPGMLWMSPQGNIWNRVLVWGLALSVFLHASTQGGYVLLVLAIYWMGKGRLPDYKPPVWFWLLLALVPLQVLLWGLINTRMEVNLETLVSEKAVWRTYVSSPAMTLFLATGAYWLLHRDCVTKPVIWLSLGASAGLLTWAVMTWNDQQAELYFDSPERQAAIAPVAAIVPENAIVYWADSPDKAWFWLGRANYLSFVQIAGLVFSREIALEALRRAPYVSAFSLNDSSQSWYGRPQTGRTGVMSHSAVRQACRDPILDYVIDRSQPEPGLTYFKDPATGWGYGLYDCRAVRASGATVSTANAVDIQERI